MRLGYSALIMGTVLAVSSLAHATPLPKSATDHINASQRSTTPTNPAPITADALAQVTAILNYCSQVDRPNTAAYERALANILSGHAPSEIKGGQSAAAYEAGKRSIDLQLRSLPVGTVTSACKNFLAGK